MSADDNDDGDEVKEGRFEFLIPFSLVFDPVFVSTNPSKGDVFLFFFFSFFFFLFRFFDHLTDRPKSVS